LIFSRSIEYLTQKKRCIGYFLEFYFYKKYNILGMAPHSVLLAIMLMQSLLIKCGGEKLELWLLMLCAAQVWNNMKLGLF
jgi:hypothetical protein